MPWGKLLDCQQRVLIGWFGIRGVGSLYYLFYCLGHDLSPGAGELIINLTVSVVALSILLHGVTTQPILARYRADRWRTRYAPSLVSTFGPSIS